MIRAWNPWSPNLPMPDKTPQPVSLESLDRKHEVSERRVRNVLMIAGGAWCLLVFSLAASAATVYLLAQQRQIQHMEPLGIILAPDLKPLDRFPKPDLQIDDDHGERLSLYGAENRQLNSYGWVDQSNGIVRIPVERAMDLVLERGLPSETNGAPRTGGSARQLLQNIPGGTK